MRAGHPAAHFLHLLLCIHFYTQGVKERCIINILPTGKGCTISHMANIRERVKLLTKGQAARGRYPTCRHRLLPATHHHYRHSTRAQQDPTTQHSVPQLGLLFSPSIQVVHYCYSSVTPHTTFIYSRT